ncbi:MAG TPA: DHA2 family efflux MFS transporter permease subunit, partial [Chloroflexota bacterium]|nr:DHA2 family efflux MFS transporter permease subunit [Chloroflexota bacterium]
VAVPALPRPRAGAFLAGLDYQWQVLLCAVVGTFMVMLDQTVVNIALPKITTVFGVGVHETQLVITSYMLALAVIMPATGYLSDTFGTKRLYLITMALFTGGSLLCGLAWNNSSLVAFRVIQGLGGGMMSPLGMTMLFQVVPPQRRNTIMGFFGLPLMLAPVLGPTLGGYLVEYIDWRVIFTLNVPIGMIGLFLGWTLLRESAHVPGLVFDFRGFVLSAVGFSAMLLGLSDAATDGWSSPPVLIRFAIGTVALIAWVYVELTDAHPLLDLRLFKIPIFTFSALVSFVLTVGMFGGMLVLPLFLQNLRGLGAAESGLILMTQVLPMTIAMPIVGRLVDKVGARVIIVIGLPLLALTTWQMSALDLSTSDTTIKLWLAARGAAMGLVMMPSMTAGLNAVPLPQMSRASAMSNVMRQVFGAFGTAIVVTILQQRQTFHTAILSQTLTPESIPLQQMLATTQQWALSQGLSLVQAQALAMMVAGKQLALSAAVMGFDDVFRVTAVVTLLAIPPALFMKTKKAAPGAAPILLD